MAVIMSPFTRALDDDGAPMAGAKLYTRDAAAHATPKASYTTNAISVAHPNPIVADDAGWFPQAFALSGENFYLILVASDGDPNDPYKTADAVPSLGADNVTEFTQTFPDARWAVTSGEVTTGNDGVIYSHGLPSPTNTGGFAELGGWAGTQGDHLRLDFSELNTTGILTENSKKLAGVVATPATTFAAAASVDIALPNVPTGVMAWRLELWDIVTSAVACNVQVQFSYNSGATYKSGAADYAYVTTLVDAAASTTYPSLTRDDAHTLILMAIAFRTPSPIKGMFRWQIKTPASGSDPTTIIGDGMSFDNAATPSANIFHAAGFGLGGYGKATNIRVSVSTGTIAGKYLVSPLRGYGE